MMLVSVVWNCGAPDMKINIYRNLYTYCSETVYYRTVIKELQCVIIKLMTLKNCSSSIQL